MLRIRQVGALALTLIVSAPLAIAEETKPAPPTGPAPAANKEGTYGGVTPGVANPYGDERLAPHPSKNTRKLTMTWIGYQGQPDGSSRIFIQSNSELRYEQSLKNGKLTVFIEGLRYRTKNSKRPLDTRFFDGRVAGVKSRAVAKKRGRSAGIEIEVEFKNPQDAVEASASTKVTEDGVYYLFLEFPAGRPIQD